MRKLKLLIAACALLVSAGVQAQKDVTSQYITNATLSDGTNGWTKTFTKNQQTNDPADAFSNSVRGNNTVGYASEAYAGWGSLIQTAYSMKQTITLPAGNYTLVNYSFFRQGDANDAEHNSVSKAYLKAGSNSILLKSLRSIAASGYANNQAEGANAFDSKMYRNTLDFTIDADNTSIEIGIEGTFDEARSWCIVGQFELIDNGTAATMDAPFDVTGYITNPGFEYRDMTGWAQDPSDFFGTQNNNQGFKVGGYYAEKWQASGALPAGSFSQTLTDLPAGFYKLTANLGGNGTYVSLNGKTANWEADKDYTVGYVLAENEGLTITAGKTAEGTANWIHFDNFRLQFCGDVAAALTTLCAKVTEYENKLPATYYNQLQAAVAAYNKNYSDVDELLAAIDAVQALYDAADAAIACYAALAQAQAVDQTAKMNAEVLSALQSAISDAVALNTQTATIAEVNAVTTALTTATANATASIANYAEAKTILDAASIYDADGQASYAANETIAAIQTAYDNGTLEAVTPEQNTAAQAALVTACKAQTQPNNGCDMTPWIVNPNFDGNADGWTTERNGNGFMAEPFNSGNFIEFWETNTVDANAQTRFFDYYQTITNLPNGAYTITADMKNSTNGEENDSGCPNPELVNWNGGGNAGLYGKTASDEVQKLITIDGATNNQIYLSYTTDEILVIDGELRIGVKNINPLTGRWFAADNFKLTYVRQLTAEEEETIAKAEAVVAYNEALAAAQAITEGSIPTTAYSNLQDVITNNTLSDGTSTEYNAAATALNEAVEAATPLVAPYAAWKALKPQADALVAVSNNDDTANGTLNDAITAQSTAAEGATAAGTITTATSTLKAAMVTYVTTAEPTNDECFDLTFMIENPHFTEGEGGTAIPTGWNLENGSITEHRLLTHNFEAYHKTFNLSQTITGLSKGTYKVTLQGFARHDNNGPTDKTNLYCGIVNQPIKDIKDEYSTENLAAGKTALGDNNGAASYTLGDQTVWQPNGMSGSYYFFQETNPATNQLFYTNEVQTLITSDGDLKIGFKCETTTDWVIWDNFHLYYYGSAIAVTIDENEASSSYSEDIENANVTLKRTFTTGKWNTISLPFDLTEDETKAAFGSDAQVATFSETADGTNSEVEFNIADDASITANTPVLLKTSTTETTFTFNGMTIKAGEAKVEGTNFDFVGTYAATTTIAEGDYFIGGDKLWKSTGSTTIKGTRAYLKAKNAEAGARITNFVIEASEASGIEGFEFAEKNNGKVYNLNGQEVKNAQKGLYIVNGKKVVVK